MDVFYGVHGVRRGKGEGERVGGRKKEREEKEKEGGEGGRSTTILSKSPKAARKNHQCPMSLFPSLAWSSRLEILLSMFLCKLV